MTDESKHDKKIDKVGPATQQMIELMEAEIERLKVALELARSGHAPNRRSLIKHHVSRIDERQDALEKLVSMQTTVSADGSR